MTPDTRLEILLIEDNPGDARLIEEMLRDADRLLERVDTDDAAGDGARVHHESSLDAGLERAESMAVDVILLDLGLPESTGLDTLATVTEATDFVPIVVLTGLDDEATGIRAIEQGAQDYLVKDEVTSDLLVRSIHHAIERNRQERDRARRREQLQSLNRLNRIGHDVTHAVITTATREDLERAVCERIVESDAFQFAWIGEVDRLEDTITPRVSAGEDGGYLEAVTVSLTDEDIADGPAATAVETRTVQVQRDIRTDGDADWREAAVERGFLSGALIPIEHEDVLYGVLNVYSSTPTAFSDAEREILARLGDVVGHAITAIERKEALVSDTVLEMEFQTTEAFDDLVALTASVDGKISVGNVVHTNGSVLAYGQVDGLASDAFREAAADLTPTEEVRILTSGTDEFEFELETTELGPLASAVATHGGRIESATIEDGSLRFVVQFPPGRDRRQLSALVEEHVPDLENVAQRVVDRSDEEVASFRSVFEDRLTEKQRTALETAYFAGLFDWPRKSTGQEVAERLGVSPPTFTQHLRAAEQKFFDAVFEASDDADE